MQTSHYSAPTVRRSRPSSGALIFGSFFLWGGVAGILHDTTTMGLGPSLTIALSATGFAVAVLILLPRFSDTEPSVSEPTPQTVQPPQTEQSPQTVQTTVQDGSTEAEESDEANEIQKMDDQELADDKGDPWDADQGWASDIRW